VVEVVKAEAVSVRYGRSSVPQVDSVTITIGQGVTALVGKNGAGKSTLIKAIVGLLRPESGQLDVLGADVAERRLGPDELARLGYLPQDFGYVSTFTARDFVEYGAWLKKVPTARLSAAVDAALATVGLSEKARVKMRKLSGGMRRRAGIAQALVHEPELLILDEPTSGLDPEQRVKFRELIRDLAADRSVLMSSHLIEDVRALAQHIVVLDEGHLRFAGTVEALERRGEMFPAGDSLLERGYLAVVTA
jgi:ABC-2 type transport system ATP-binding protein